MILTAQTIALLVCVPALAYFLVKWLFTKDTEIENRRRNAANLAGKLQSYGLVRTPAILVNYSVGDYSGMVHEFRKIVDLFLDGEDGLLKELDGVFESVLSVKLASDEGRAYLATRLAEHQPTIAA